MSFDWREHDSESLESHFNPRIALGQDVALALIASYTEKAEAARQVMTGLYNQRYGEAPKATMDVHPGKGDGPRPILFFVHGGFWRALDKSDHSFIAPAFVNAGVTVVNVNYDLCPEVTLDTIVEQIRAALAFTRRNAFDWGGDPRRVTIAGHSAGAQLVGMLLNAKWDEPIVASAVALSGIYEPEVVLKLGVNEEIRLDADMAKRNDCIQQPPKVQIPLLVAAGGEEPEGWREQSRLYAKVAAEAGCTVTDIDVPEKNHFTLVDDFADPEGDSFQRTMEMIGR
ncbi:MAG: alpha/beta hydrolase [Alphaproteobacteria bacterium]